MINQNHITIARQAIQDHFGFNIEIRKRTRKYVIARQYYYRWMKDNTPMSLEEIGGTLPSLSQDHSTIIHALKEFDDKMLLETEYRMGWHDIMAKINRLTGKVFDEEFLILNAS